MWFIGRLYPVFQWLDLLDVRNEEEEALAAAEEEEQMAARGDGQAGCLSRARATGCLPAARCVVAL